MSLSSPVRPRPPYRGRIAPTPTGWLHLGHAQTFAIAWQRARAAGGALVYRTEDLDADRCRPAFADGALEDLRWLGLTWEEGPDLGGPHAPYTQSERLPWFREVWQALRATGQIYPSPHSRKDVAEALRAPHPEGAEPIFPVRLRPSPDATRYPLAPEGVNWRFRVPAGEVIRFEDGRRGPCAFEAGVDFGDFLVWRKDGFPSYEMAVVADDHAMGITEVVRGEDLLLSTARQLLLYRALGWTAPAWYHTALVRDASGRRLAKRHDALTLRTLRARGADPDTLRPPA